MRVIFTNNDIGVDDRPNSSTFDSRYFESFDRDEVSTLKVDTVGSSLILGIDDDTIFSGKGNSVFSSSVRAKIESSVFTSGHPNGISCRYLVSGML